ncbi:MAG: sugar phosphate isomerase/epimerase family protein [Phycisphaerae bacterium]
MKPFKIGVICDSFRVGPREGVKKAREVGADGIQVYAVQGEICPEAMDSAARREFKAFVAAQGLAISALCGDLGGHGFARARDNPAKVERSRKIVDLAVDLGTNIVTTHIGVVPADKKSQEHQAMLAACRELGQYARSKGVTFAIETGPETAVRLKGFLDDVGSAGIGVNLDPANLVMVTGDDPVAAVKTLAKYIVHTHAKDGVKLGPCDPVKVYHAFAEGGVEGMDMGKLFNEVPLGEGQVRWDEYLAALEAIGFKGFLTIEREVGPSPEADIRKAVEFLKARIA